MTDERRTQIEEIAKEYGFSFASAKKFLEEIESEVDTNEAMAEMWYWYESDIYRWTVKGRNKIQGECKWGGYGNSKNRKSTICLAYGKYQRLQNRAYISIWIGGIEKVQYNDIGIALNTLAREQMKYKLMADIRADIEVC